MDELVSIITPSFNQGKYLAETMGSVLRQDYSHLEYIVIDGASTDNSVEILRSFEKELAYWRSEPDKGQTEAINKGFAQAKGQIFAWINSDDTYNPGAVSQAVQYLHDHPDVGVVYSDLNFIDEDSRVIGKFPAAQTDLARLRRGYVHVPQPAAFFRAELWKQVGPLDDSFFFAMDYDLWVRLAKISKLQYLPGKVWANFRLHAGAKTVDADARCWPEMLRVHYRDGGSVFSAIVAKYYLRKIAAPLLRWRLRRRFTAATKK
ncbi:MAG: glycosyltransferase family 2 protein [Anaerolineaceae bacterium]